MSDQWKEFLEDAGAVLDADGRVLHFGNPSREQRVAASGSVIADLSHRALITVSGADAAKFLQGQLTNDISGVDAGHSQLSGYCTPKGRLLAIVRIFRRDDAYQLQLPAMLLDTIIERLRKYVLMSKVSLAPTGDALIGVGLSGPHAGKDLAQLGASVPEAVDDVVRHDQLTILRIPGVHPRFEIHGPREAMEKAWARLDVHAAPVGSQAWTLLDVLAGVPEIVPATSEEFIPQTVNLDLLGGISLSKGCYTGQEIVARLHYRGTLKRRMYLAYSPSSRQPQAGEAVHSPGAGEQAAGHVVTAAEAPGGGSLLLVSAIQEHAASGALYLQGPSGSEPIELRDLPYLAAGAAG